MTVAPLADGVYQASMVTPSGVSKAMRCAPDGISPLTGVRGGWVP
jgi:hypothetical protein